MQPIQVRLQADNFFVWNATDAAEIRSRYRITAGMLGRRAQLPDAETDLLHRAAGLPMILMPEEVWMGYQKGWFVVTKFDLLHRENNETVLNHVQSVEDKFKHQWGSFQELERQKNEKLAEWKSTFPDLKKGPPKWPKSTFQLENALPKTPPLAPLRKNTDHITGSSLFVGSKYDESAQRILGPQLQLENKFSKLIICTHEEIEQICLSYADFSLRYKVYIDLYERGYWISTGIKFGCDFMAYCGPPSGYHASYMIIISLSDRPLSLFQILSVGRLSTNVNKFVILASVQDSSVSYTTYHWDQAASKPAFLWVPPKPAIRPAGQPPVESSTLPSEKTENGSR